MALAQSKLMKTERLPKLYHQPQQGKQYENKKASDSIKLSIAFDGDGRGTENNRQANN
jgi:hypothetical protein